MWPKYKFDLKRCLTKVTFISKLHNILLTKNIFAFLIKKCNFQLLKKSVQLLERDPQELTRLTFY